jgi:opacity protein-like surface antigen
MRIRIAVLLLALAASASARVFSIGVKGGVPLTGVIGDTSFGGDPGAGDGFSLHADHGNYVVGPTFELHLPARLSVEFDILYRTYSACVDAGGVECFLSGSSEAWQFPLLGKYRLTGGMVAPYLSGGIAFRRLGDLSRLGDILNDRTNTGLVLGFGLEGRLPVIRLSPEIRYTYWWVTQPRGGSNPYQKNQVELLVGITF